MFRIKKRLRGKRNPNPRNNSMQKDREDKILEAARDFMREGLKDMREHGATVRAFCRKQILKEVLKNRYLEVKE